MPEAETMPLPRYTVYPADESALSEEGKQAVSHRLGYHRALNMTLSQREGDILYKIVTYVTYIPKTIQ